MSSGALSSLQHMAAAIMSWRVSRKSSEKTENEMGMRLDQYILEKRQPQKEGRKDMQRETCQQ